MLSWISTFLCHRTTWKIFSASDLSLMASSPPQAYNVVLSKCPIVVRYSFVLDRKPSSELRVTLLMTVCSGCRNISHSVSPTTVLFRTTRMITLHHRLLIWVQTIYCILYNISWRGVLSAVFNKTTTTQ